MKKPVLGDSTTFLLKNAFKRKEKLVLALVSLILRNLKQLHVSQVFSCGKTYNVHKTLFKGEKPSFSAFNVVLLENAFKRRKKLALALDSPSLQIQCVCTFPSAFIALKPTMCIKRVFSAK